MRLRFFTVPALSPGHTAEEVSAFLSIHPIVEITREFVANVERASKVGVPNAYWRPLSTGGAE